MMVGGIARLEILGGGMGCESTYGVCSSIVVCREKNEERVGRSFVLEKIQPQQAMKDMPLLLVTLANGAGVACAEQ
jgi:hypothetical protein